MGYHIILKQDKNGIEHHFVENLHELANFPISKNSIIYQGEPTWNPVMALQSETYNNFTYDWFRAGIKAQDLFKKQALKEKYILEELSQDKESFKFYTGIDKEYLSIKRGDFLFRNVMNIEVDVKCRNFYYSKVLKSKVFEFNSEHLERHLNMFEFTKTPIVIAIYERVKDSDEVNPNSLIMIDIHYMKKIINQLDLKKIKRNSGKNTYWVYTIPVKKTKKKFELIEYFKNKKKY